ncbi:MAG: 16S rRNA (cytosine(967)-C(5))-methyltransferase RsmB [Firmicutes bacterium]|nr:16S rRNA (cytosine(967)-C(5))-methyltransferase RsmB [Bacillota bacterium]
MADINRKTAYQTLLEIEKNQAYSNIELNHQISQMKPENPAFVRELVYGVLENQMYLDHILGQLIPKGLKGVKKPIKVLLRMGLYQLMFMDSVPEYAAVNETVKLARKVAPGRDGFLNGVLRGYGKKKEQLTMPDPEKDLTGYLSARYSFDPTIVELWLSQYSAEETERLLACSNMRPPLSIRVNLTKTTAEDLERELTGQGFTLEKAALCDRVFFVKGSGLLDTKAFKDGLFSVQDTASVLAVDTLAPEPGDVVLDICAAPGGKTLAMGEKMENRGRILAFDVYAHKLELMQVQAERLGLSIIETGEQDGTVFNGNYVEMADKVLVDGPCSGLGVLRRKPEIKYRPVENESQDLAEKQLAILENACRYVKPGGDLLYSTCTINRRENGDVARAFLEKHKEYEMILERQLLPGIDEADGFYICRMHRKLKGDR